MSTYLEEKTLPELRDIAEELGIEFPNNIGKAKLIEKIKEDDEAVEGKPAKKVAIEEDKPKKKMTPTEIKKEMNKLVRCRITAADPQYQGRNGVTLQVGNGTTVVGKFIPFDLIWHAQEPVLNALKQRKWRKTVFKTDRTTGMKVPKTTMHPSFIIEELPQLTEKELKKLAEEQAARGSIPTENDIAN